LKNNILFDDHIKNIKEILDGNELDIKSEYSTMIGLKILTFLYQTGEDFEKFANTMFNMTLDFKEFLNDIKD
jgi:hypothetical protein